MNTLSLSSVVFALFEFNILFNPNLGELHLKRDTNCSNHTVKSLKLLGITTSPHGLKFVQSMITLGLQWESQHLPLIRMTEEQMQIFSCNYLLLPALYINCASTQESSNSLYGQKTLWHPAKSIPHPALEQPGALTNAHKHVSRSTCPATQGKWTKTNILSLNATCGLWLHFPFWFCSPSVFLRHTENSLCFTNGEFVVIPARRISQAPESLCQLNDLWIAYRGVYLQHLHSLFYK